MENTTSRERIVAIVALAAPIVWQLYAVTSAIRSGPVARNLFAGVGAPLPMVTRYFFASYPYWWLAPAAFAGLSYDVLRRHDPPLSYFSFVLVTSVIASLALHVWVTEAFFAPIFSILQKIG
jgi:hypothetical protein